jgi:formylglycine-generating enzyme required for sulfatase activity
MSTPKSKGAKVFISYSHQDVDWLTRLRVHLKPLERDYEVDVWDDTKIRPSSNWREEIKGAIMSARVAVLLVSADFLASEFIDANELPPLLKAAEQGGTAILPVILSPSWFAKTEGLSKFQAVNSPSQPLIGLSRIEQEAIFARVAETVHELLSAPPWEKTVGGPAGGGPATAEDGAHADARPRQGAHRAAGAEAVTIVDAATGRPLTTCDPPRGLLLPPGHRYLTDAGSPHAHTLLRARDLQTVLYLPEAPLAGRPFLIDKYLVTNLQYAAFLNDAEVRAHTEVVSADGMLVVRSAEGRLLAAEVSGFKSGVELGEPQGLVYVGGRWEPTPRGGQLPVTLVTAWGGSLYAAWARGMPLPGAEERGLGLPREGQWTVATLWDYSAGVFRTFPWGDTWDRLRLNSLSYWTDREVPRLGDGDVRSLSGARATPVGAFPGGASPSGMMDAFGNVWEWLADSDAAGRQMIKGGAFTSPQSAFLNADPMYRQPEFVGPANGFRCGWELG